MDKIDRLLDAMEHPNSYSPTEIEAMLQDPEVKEVFDVLDKTKSSLQTIDTPDIEAEWKKFEEKNNISENHRFHRFAGLFSRNAAASIAIGIASFTAIAAIVSTGIHHLNNNRKVTAKEIEVVSRSGIIPIQSDTIKSIDQNIDNDVQIIIFDNEPLETVMNKIATFYGYKVVFNEYSTKSLRLYFRWNQSDSFEKVVERLNNFEQIKLTVNNKTIKVD